MKTVSKWQRLQLKTKILKLVKYLDEGVKLALLFDITFPNSLKQFQNNILRPNNKRKFETWNHVFFFWGENVDFLSFFQNLEIQNTLWRHKVKVGPKRGQIFALYSNCDKKIYFNNLSFFEVAISFLRRFLELWYYGPLLIPRSEVILRLGQKET